MICRLLALALLIAAGPATARADWASCLAGLQKAAAAAGVDQATIQSATGNLEPNDAASFIGQQPEFTTPIWDYMAALVDEERVAEGRQKLGEYANALAAARERFGVDPATLVAIWGVESDYGKGFGWRPVVQSLATLSCTANRRADAFRGEFFATMKIFGNGDVRPEEFKGSWAGAFGHTQFMPTTFLRMRGRSRRRRAQRHCRLGAGRARHDRELFAQERLGFEPALGFRGEAAGKLFRPERPRHARAMSNWASRGITRIDGSPLGGGSAALILPAGNTGPAFLVTRNFDALYSYNNAISYALAIAVLSDRLRGRPGIQTPWPTDDPGLSRLERKELQTLLQQRGYRSAISTACSAPRRARRSPISRTAPA